MFASRGRAVRSVCTAAMICVTICACALASCGHDEGGSSPSLQWRAYAFDQTITPLYQQTSTLRSFRMNETYSVLGNVTEFTIEGSYLGTELTQVATRLKQCPGIEPQKCDETVIYTEVRCHKLNHRVTVDNSTAQSHPDWAEITVWIPCDNIEVLDDTFGICAKATYGDSDGNRASWSYYLTDTMKTSVQAQEEADRMSYLPCIEGDFRGLDQSVLNGLYSILWQCFSCFATGGRLFLADGSWTLTGEASKTTYECHHVIRTCGAYDFDAWEISTSISEQDIKADYYASLSYELPLPYYFEASVKFREASVLLRYTLTDVELRPV